MWIATDSQTTSPILVEIETPHSRWWHADGSEVHSDFSHAQGQLAEWRAWFADPRNQISFSDYYDLPSLLRHRKLEPRFVLVHGRRRETGEDRARLAKRGQLDRRDERIMTFDRLSPEEKAVGLMCVRISQRGYELHRIPPTFRVSNWDDEEYAAIHGWDRGLAASPELHEGRAAYIQGEVAALVDEYDGCSKSKWPRRSDSR